MCSLPKGWEVKTLGEVCEVLDKLRKPITKRNRIEGAYPYYGATGILSYVHKYIFDEKLVLIGEDGAKWLSGDNTSFIVKGKYWVNNHAHVIRPNRSEVLDEWIVYFLNFSNLSKYVTGLTVPKLNQEKMKSITIPIPPLTEQKQIVKKLDTCFAEINQAKTNLEQNTQNTKDLFQSTLTQIFTNPNNDWKIKTLGETVNKASSNISLNKIKDNVGIYPLFKAKGFAQNISFYHQENEYLAILKDGAGIGRVSRHPPKSSVIATMQYIIPNNGFDISFIQYFLNKMNFEKYRTGSTIPHIYFKDYRKEKIPIPPITEQKQIVKKLDQLNQQSQTLDENYQNQLKLLTELKQSLLEKAFNGELILSNKLDNTIKFPVQVSGISTTDLHAGLIALAYRQHDEAGKLSDFGHVKVEKISHLIEFFVGIDLDRNPVKDVAGPNDFRHLKKVEHRANKANYFDAIKRESGYIYQPKNGFNRIITKVKNKLSNEQLKQVNMLISKMINMNTKQAEIFATVYTAWNNLLILNKDIFDEAIVTEARENWHKDKLKIDRDKFLIAIKWMKDNNLAPKGRGKLVK